MRASWTSSATLAAPRVHSTSARQLPSAAAASVRTSQPARRAPAAASSLQSACAAPSPAHRHAAALAVRRPRWAKNGLPLRLVLARPGAPQQAMTTVSAWARSLSPAHSSAVRSQTWTARPSTNARNGIPTPLPREVTLARRRGV